MIPLNSKVAVLVSLHACNAKSFMTTVADFI